MLQILKNFLNGLVFGLSLIIPGLSGGTLAIILGFYDQLIEAVNHFTEDFKHYIKFLLPFGLGIAIGIIAFATFIQFMLTYHSFPAMMFFIGLIVGVIPSMYRQASGINAQNRAKDLALIVIPVLLLVLTAHFNDGVSAASPAEAVLDTPFMLFIFVVGIIAAASLLIPGLSGSFVLLVAGIYPLATYAVSSMRRLLTDMGNTDLLLDIIRVLMPLGIGVVLGVLVTARLIERLMKRRARSVFLVVTGLMIGSVYALAIDPVLMQSGVSVPVVVVGVVSCVVGAVLSFRISRVEK